jgi:hypothetical protein
VSPKVPERITFYFESEARIGADRDFWRTWVEAHTATRGWTLEMGDYRPGLRVVTPFLRQNKGESIRANLAVENASLEDVLALVDALRAVARPVVLLLTGEDIGRVTPSGPDENLQRRLIEWQALIDKHPGDARPSPAQPGMVSIWLATFSDRAEFDAFFEEKYGTDGPISAFARAIGVSFYDHDGLEAIWLGTATPVADAVARLSFAASFTTQLATADKSCTAIVALFGHNQNVVPPKQSRHVALLGVGEFRGA